MRCINLLERPTSGKVYVEGEELTAMTPRELRKRRKKIGMIFQQFNLFAARTVYENIALMKRVKNAFDERGILNSGISYDV